ncbi:DsbA family protein [Deinococcus koreensis]|uniref:Disulfide bond formation protein DsbA n=1 Tax=Deinococcus koreensis TaxID=2054903 RepID=A0A2K3UX57_9DEIO|nr:DsbA family protein [Deinococcus koreensis]PNY81119.1 disulfide bond formation protein DsbA [Deinococcus koreensis]
MTDPCTDLYVDFLCPYAWRGVELAAVLRGEGEPFRLRHFSLVEGNHPDNVGERTWHLDEQPSGEGNAYQQSSLAAFLAAQAAARQGEEAGWAFTLALFRRRHEGGGELDEAGILNAAGVAGLDLVRFAHDRADEAGLRAELDEAAGIGVFGTPTFVLPDGSAAYYRFELLTRDPQTARQWWELYRTVLGSGASIGTIKRARHRPAPKPAA